MDSEEILAKLEEKGIVYDDGEWVSITESFEGSLNNWREAVDELGDDEVASDIMDMLDDVDLSQKELRHEFSKLDNEVGALYLALRDTTDFDDKTAMTAARMLKQLTDPDKLKCGKCGFEANQGSQEWIYTQDPSLGDITKCPECGSTDLRHV